MSANEAMGIIFSNMHDEMLRELTGVRTMGSVPFGGRYRLIDFPLSNMVNSGISKVGVITKSNYQSLMDHLGSGKAWDLARKTGGLFILPPFGVVSSGFYQSRVEALYGIRQFLQHSSEEYVMVSDCDVVANIDLEKFIDRHIESGAKISFLCKRGEYSSKRGDVLVFDTDADSRVTDILISPEDSGGKLHSLNMYIIEKQYLMDVVADAMSRNYTSLYRDVFQKVFREEKICAYEFEGFSAVIDSMPGYVRANMALLNAEVRAQLFDRTRPIYTKIRDEMPVKYGLGAKVSNSLIADGCTIEGTVENSIVFREVKIGKGARVTNSIIMQGGVIGEDAVLDYVTTDKNVVIRPGRNFMGFESYPVFLPKGETV